MINPFHQFTWHTAWVYNVFTVTFTRRFFQKRRHPMANKEQGKNKDKDKKKKKKEKVKPTK
jgi:hypothetical protein